MSKTLSQKNFMNFVRNKSVTGYRCILYVNFLFVMCANALRIVLLT